MFCFPWLYWILIEFPIMQSNMDEENTKSFFILNEIILTLKDVRATSWYMIFHSVAKFHAIVGHIYEPFCCGEVKRNNLYCVIVKYNFTFPGAQFLCVGNSCPLKYLNCLWDCVLWFCYKNLRGRKWWIVVFQYTNFHFF